MERSPAWNAVMDDVFLVELQNAGVEDVSAVARALVDFGTEPRGSSLQLPLHCTDSPTRTCRLLKQLPKLNDLLYYIGAEVSETRPGGIAVRCYTSISFSNYIRRDQRMVEAIICFQCIVARHRCVDVLELRLQPREQRDLDTLMCKTTKWVTLLSGFHLSDSVLNNAAITTETFAAVTRLLRSQLAELSLEDVRLSELSKQARASLDAFMTAVSETRDLKRLKVVNVALRKEASVNEFDFVTRLLQALANNTSICRLTLDSSFPAHRHGSSFKRMLARPWAPPYLAVVCPYHSYRSKSNLVFDALVSNETVTKLTVESFKLGIMDSKSLSKFLASNNTMEEMTLISTEWDVRTERSKRIRWHAEHLADGLRKATSLQRLALTCDFSSAEIRWIIKAAHESESLKEVHFWEIREGDLEPISAVRQEMADKWKITIGRFCVSMYSDSAKQIAGFHEALPNPEKCDPLNLMFAPPGHSCDTLRVPCGDHLTSLLLTGGYFMKVPPEIARGLGLYLALTRSLRQLSMEFETSHDSARYIIEGIAKNKTIEWLHIERFSVKNDDWETLGRWLIDNRHLHSLDISLPYRDNDALAKPLAASLESNYTITAAKIFDFDLKKPTWMHIKNMVRRNCGLVRCAAAFVLGVSHKRAAVAYELVSWHPQLPMAVQDMGLLSKDEAMTRIEQSPLRLRDEFWKLSGIVKEHLICNKPPAGANGQQNVYQLDKLGVYMLDHIRSYLKVGDILDDEEDDPWSESAQAATQRCSKRKRSDSPTLMQQVQ
ncbi:uncharacterized protein LOC119450619 isoform X3 [Dermacentor silvarum]|uniref:uncharacterized protein LOC119450619 isoform X3 n=1 Tax=Dermacentor silvarum TaxID=543639 RepID=UPI0021012038|nr:uncharacterized protein LOC119450619 isoform X3 [Dermacentor silvarum]